MYDLAVVGAGPAGSMAALEGAKAGLKVILIDKEILPRFKLCGGAISKKTLDIFHSKGIELPESLILNEISRIKITTLKTFKYVDYHQPFTILTRRDDFDYFLALEARKAGAEILQETRITDIVYDEKGCTLHSDKKEILARYVIGADGVNGIIGKRSGLIEGFSKHEVGVGAEIEYPMAQEEIKLNIGQGTIEISFGEAAFSYSWVFPRKDSLIIGVAELGSNMGKGKSIKDILINFTEKLDYLDKENIPKHRADLIPMGGLHRKVASDRVLLCGDAAGFADPLAGEGTYYGIQSAILAVETIMETIRADGSVKAYQEKCDSTIQKDLRAALKMARFLYSFPAYSYFMFEKSKELSDLPIFIATGDLSFSKLYKKLLFQGILLFPSYLLSRLPGK